VPVIAALSSQKVVSDAFHLVWYVSHPTDGRGPVVW
jgi:hypothetical protein